MPDLPEQASVHPETITRFSQGELRPLRKRRTRQSRAVPLDYSFKIDPKAWKIAMDIADGDAARIEVISERELLVHNNDNWR